MDNLIEIVDDWGDHHIGEPIDQITSNQAVVTVIDNQGNTWIGIPIPAESVAPSFGASILNGIAAILAVLIVGLVLLACGLVLWIVLKSTTQCFRALKRGDLIQALLYSIVPTAVILGFYFVGSTYTYNSLEIAKEFYSHVYVTDIKKLNNGEVEYIVHNDLSTGISMKGMTCMLGCWLEPGKSVKVIRSIYENNGCLELWGVGYYDTYPMFRDEPTVDKGYRICPTLIQFTPDSMGSKDYIKATITMTLIYAVVYISSFLIFAVPGYFLYFKSGFLASIFKL